MWYEHCENIRIWLADETTHIAQHTSMEMCERRETLSRVVMATKVFVYCGWAIAIQAFNVLPLHPYIPSHSTYSIQQCRVFAIRISLSIILISLTFIIYMEVFVSTCRPSLLCSGSQPECAPRKNTYQNDKIYLRVIIREQALFDSYTLWVDSRPSRSADNVAHANRILLWSYIVANTINNWHSYTFTYVQSIHITV